MKPISDPRHPQWNMHANQMREALGLKYGAQLPREGLPPREIQGWIVWVNPWRPKEGKGKTHRVMARCPMCKQIMSAGRTHQHKCVGFTESKSIVHKIR